VVSRPPRRAEQALAIACTADAIKIAPQLPAAVGVRLDHPSD
jgi:hypothetical protein